VETKGQQSVRPDAISYNTVMLAYAKQGQAAKAEALLEEMYAGYSTNGNENAKPTIVSFNVVINGWAKLGQPEAAEKALSLLWEMQSLWKQGHLSVRGPDAISYGTVISANAKQGEAAKAEALLKEMFLDYSTNGNESAKPTMIDYNVVMNCWAKSRQLEATEKALALLREMQSLWKQGHQSVRPNVI
jgi:pentatricopeptide repeat protein